MSFEQLQLIINMISGLLSGLILMLLSNATYKSSVFFTITIVLVPMMISIAYAYPIYLAIMMAALGLLILVKWHALYQMALISFAIIAGFICALGSDLYGIAFAAITSVIMLMITTSRS